jgi:hypothetical protein
MTTSNTLSKQVVSRATSVVLTEKRDDTTAIVANIAGETVTGLFGVDRNKRSIIMRA